MKKISIILILVAASQILKAQTQQSPAQDTVYMKEVRVPYNGLVDKKGRIKKIWYRIVKVDSGYIIRKGDYYVINGKEIRAELFREDF